MSGNKEAELSVKCDQLASELEEYNKRWAEVECSLLAYDLRIKAKDFFHASHKEAK